MPRQNHPMPFSPQIDMKTMVPPRRWSTIEGETLICGELFRLWKLDRQLIKTYQISLALRDINDILSSFHLPFGLAFICVLRMFRKKVDMINMHAPILATNNGLHDARARGGIGSNITTGTTGKPCEATTTSQHPGKIKIYQNIQGKPNKFC